MNNRLGDKKPVAVGMECATVLAYNEAFHVIRLYTEQVGLSIVITV